MASFRPLKPVMTDHLDVDGVQPRQAPAASEHSERRIHGKRTRGSHQVAQACPNCRQSKAKCDGARPRCGNCVAKNKQCGYIGEAGQSRQAAMMTRLDSLETLFKQLQNRPDKDAEELYNRIRGLGDGTDLSRIITDIIHDPESELASQHSSTRASHTGSAYAGSPHADIETDFPSNSASQSPLIPNRHPFAVDGATSPPVDEQQAVVLAKIALPDRHTLTRATDAFFHSTLQPFLVFSRSEVAEFMRLVYEDPISYHRAGHVPLACLAALAAVGARYLHDTGDKAAVTALYDIARFYIENAIEEAPLDAIKCCVLLAMCSFMVKSTAALVYVELGLGMAKRLGLYASSPRNNTIALHTWAEYRRAWRALMCLSSWVPSTAGFNDDYSDSLVPPSLVNTDIGPNLDHVDALQIEMTKLSFLKADLLRIRLAHPVIDIQTVESANQDLQTWYAGLPDNMLLGNLSSPEPGDGIQSCICYIHLLHLDAIMLLSRRALSEFVRTYGYRPRSTTPWTPLVQAMANQTIHGVMAASHSSRILRLIQEAGQARELNWLIMNQTNTACVILLLSVLQKQMHQFPEVEWAENLEQAELCLSILAECGLDDDLARSLHEQLSEVQKIASDERNSMYVPGPDSHMVWTADKDLCILIAPPGAPSYRLEMAVHLLNILCRPFDDSNDKQKRKKMSDKDLASTVNLQTVGQGQQILGRAAQAAERTGSDSSVSSRSTLSRAGLSQKLEDWSFENTLPFRVDARRSMRTESSDAVPSLKTAGVNTRPHSWVGGDDDLKRRKPSLG